MPKEKQTVAEMLKDLEKLVRKIMRKSLKNNTLDYTVQMSISSLEPEKVKYAAQISSPSQGVQPISFIHDNYKDLVAALKASEKEIDQLKIEKTFHQSRINTYKTKIDAHERRIKQIDSGEAEEEIPLEEV